MAGGVPAAAESARGRACISLFGRICSLASRTQDWTALPFSQPRALVCAAAAALPSTRAWAASSAILSRRVPQPGRRRGWAPPAPPSARLRAAPTWRQQRAFQARHEPRPLPPRLPPTLPTWHGAPLPGLRTALPSHHEFRHYTLFSSHNTSSDMYAWGAAACQPCGARCRPKKLAGHNSDVRLLQHQAMHEAKYSCTSSDTPPGRATGRVPPGRRSLLLLLPCCVEPAAPAASCRCLLRASMRCTATSGSATARSSRM